MDQLKKMILAGARTPVGAAALSFLFPGLGQAAAGQGNRGLIISIPMLSMIGALLLAVLVRGKEILNSAFDQTWLTSLLILDLVLLIYHLWAVADAYLQAGSAQKRQRRGGRVARSGLATFGVVLIVSGTLLIHAGFASVVSGWQGSVGCFSALTPCWVTTTLAPGQTIPITSDVPDIGAGSGDPNATPSSSGNGSTGPVGTFDPNSLPTFTGANENGDWAADGQLNVLLMGVDSGAGGTRNQGLRPDSMNVLHLDIKTGRAALIGVPRNTMCVPLPADVAKHYASPKNGCQGETWPQMLNWLANDAGWNNPQFYPYDQSSAMAYTRAVGATEAAVGTLTGLQMDGAVVINLMGLVDLINALGGVTIDVPSTWTVYDKPCGPKGTWEAAFRVCDLNPNAAAGSLSKVHDGYGLPAADGKGPSQQMINDAKNSGGKQTITWQSSNGYDIAFVIKPGVQKMDGDWALAYARTRIYDPLFEFGRVTRQQLVLTSLKDSIHPCALVPQIPGLVTSLGKAFWTNNPTLLADATQLAGLAEHMFGKDVHKINLDPPTLGIKSTQVYITPAIWSNIKTMVAHSLDTVPAASGGTSGGGGGFSC